MSKQVLIYRQSSVRAFRRLCAAGILQAGITAVISDAEVLEPAQCTASHLLWLLDLSAVSPATRSLCRGLSLSLSSKISAVSHARSLPGRQHAGGRGEGVRGLCASEQRTHVSTCTKTSPRLPLRWLRLCSGTAYQIQRSCPLYRYRGPLTRYSGRAAAMRLECHEARTPARGALAEAVASAGTVQPRALLILRAGSVIKRNKVRPGAAAPCLPQRPAPALRMRPARPAHRSLVLWL